MAIRPSAFGTRRGVEGLFGVFMTWAIVMVASPRIANACAVCTAGRDEENQMAFLLSTLFMSLLPLLAIGTLVFVLWRRIQKLEAETELRRSGSAAAVAHVAGTATATGTASALTSASRNPTPTPTPMQMQPHS